MTISKKETFAAFEVSVKNKFNGASVASIPVKRFTSNSRITMLAEGTNKDKQKKKIVKFNAVLVASIPKSRFEPIAIYTKGKQVIACACLSVHGGHVAVEIARQLAKQHGTKLVVLDKNILCLLMLDAPSSDAIARFFDASIEKLLDVSDAFHARISKLVA